MAWACYAEARQASGKVTRTPLNRTCEECWVIAVEVFGYTTFEDFTAKFNSDPKIREQVTAARRGLQALPDVPHVGSSCAQIVSQQVEIEEPVVLQLSSELLSQVDSRKLTGAQTKQLTEIELPNAENPNVHDKFYVFVDPDERPKRALIRTVYGITSSKQVLPEQRSLSETHGFAIAKRKFQDFTKPIVDAARVGKITWEKWLQDHGKEKVATSRVEQPEEVDTNTRIVGVGSDASSTKASAAAATPKNASTPKKKGSSRDLGASPAAASARGDAPDEGSVKAPGTAAGSERASAYGGTDVDGPGPDIISLLFF